MSLPDTRFRDLVWLSEKERKKKVHVIGEELQSFKYLRVSHTSQDIGFSQTPLSHCGFRRHSGLWVCPKTQSTCL